MGNSHSEEIHTDYSSEYRRLALDGKKFFDELSHRTQIASNLRDFEKLNAELDEYETKFNSELRDLQSKRKREEKAEARRRIYGYYDGLTTPWQQWVACGTVIGFVWRGIPAIKNAYWATHLSTAVRSGDEAAKADYIKKLNLKVYLRRIDTESAEFHSLLKHFRITGMKWGLRTPCILLGVFAVEEARRKKWEAVEAILDA